MSLDGLSGLSLRHLWLGPSFSRYCKYVVVPLLVRRTSRRDSNTVYGDSLRCQAGDADYSPDG